MTDPTKPTLETETPDVLERNVSTLLESGGERPRLAAEAKARIRAELIARHGRAARARWPLVAGVAMAAAAVTALLVLRIGVPSPHAPDAPSGPTPELQIVSGAQIVRAPDAQVRQLGPRHLRVDGAALIDVEPGHGAFVVDTAHGRIEVLGTRFVVDAEPDRTTAAVVRGEVKLANDRGDVTLHAGEQAIAEPGYPPTRTPAPRLTHLVSWAQQVRRHDEQTQPVHHGTLFARQPNMPARPPWGQEYPLPIAQLGVDVVVDNQVARVALDQTFHNPQPMALEGMYRFAIPPDAALQRLAMYNDGKLVEAGVAERMAARRVYEQLVYRRIDPALLEWSGTGRLALRVYPLPALQDKRLMIAYTQSLPRLYRDYTLTVPLPEVDQPVGALDVAVRVKDCSTCELSSTSHQITVSHDGGDAIVRYHSTGEKIADSFVLRVRDARDQVNVATATHGGERYLMVRAPGELGGTPVAYRPRTWVILDDVSASRDQLALRAQADMIDALTRELDENDRVAVVAFDVEARTALAPTRVLDVDRGKLRAALAHEGGVGATDFGVALDAALPLLAGVAPGDAMVVYLGDGVITSGARNLDALRAKLVGKAQFIGVGIGDAPDSQTLNGLAAATGGYATTIDLADDLAWRTFDLVAALHTARVTGLTARLVDAAGAPVAATAYLAASQLADGEQLELVAKLDPSASAAGPGVAVATMAGARPVAAAAVPAVLELTGLVDGQPWQRRIALPAPAAGDAGYLPRLWAQRHIAARLLAKHEPVATLPCAPNGPVRARSYPICVSEADAREARDEAIRQEVVALGKQYFLLSRHTSLIVLENDAMYAEYGIAKGNGETWAPYAMPRAIPVTASASPVPVAPQLASNAAGDELLRAPLVVFHDTDLDVIDNIETKAKREEAPMATRASLGIEDRDANKPTRVKDIELARMEKLGALMDQYAVHATATDPLGDANANANASGGYGYAAGKGTASSSAQPVAAHAAPATTPAAVSAGPAEPVANDASPAADVAAQAKGIAADKSVRISSDALNNPFAPDPDVAAVSARRSFNVTDGLFAVDTVGAGRRGHRSADGGSFAASRAFDFNINIWAAGSPAPIRLTDPGDVAFDDLTAFVPALATGSVDSWRDQLAAGDRQPHTIEPAASALLGAARKALPAGEYRWAGNQIALDAARNLAWRRTTADGLTELATFDGATWLRRYPELGLEVARPMRDDDLALALGELPMWIAEPAHYARWFDVALRGPHEVALARREHGKSVTALVLQFDDKARLTAISSGAGARLVEVTWSDAGPVHARLRGEPIEVAFSALPIASAVQWAASSAALLGQPGTALVAIELPMHPAAYWQQRMTGEPAGSPAWQHDARQRLAALAAIGDWVELGRQIRALRQVTAVELGDVVLASFGLAALPAAEVDALLVPFAQQPVARYLRAGHAAGDLRHPERLAQAAAGAPDGLIHALGALRTATAYFHGLRGKPMTAQVLAIGDQAPELRLVGAALLGSQPQLYGDALAVWDAISVGAYRNVARVAAARAAFAHGDSEAGAARVVALISTLALDAPPPRLIDLQSQFMQSRRGNAGWQLVWNAWHDRVLAGESYSHTLALAQAATYASTAVSDLPAILDRAAELAGDDPQRLTELARIAIRTGLGTWGEARLRALVKRQPSHDVYQLLAGIELTQSRLADALTDLEAAQNAGSDDEVDIQVVRTELAHLIDVASRLAVQAADRDARLIAQQRALAWGDRWRAIDPGNSDIDHRLGELLLAAGDSKGAWRQLSSMIERDPWSGSGYEAVAEELERYGRTGEAIAFWHQAVIIDQTDPTPRLREAQALIAVGSPGAGDAILREIAHRRWHERWEGIVYEAQALLGEGRGMRE